MSVIATLFSMSISAEKNEENLPAFPTCKLIHKCPFYFLVKIFPTKYFPPELCSLYWIFMKFTIFVDASLVIVT